MFLHIFDEIRGYSRNPTQDKWDYICETMAGSLVSGHITQEQSINLISKLMACVNK